MSENCKCGGNCETTREDFNVKSIEKALTEKKIAVAKYRDALTKMTEIGAENKIVVDLAEAKKRAESEIIKLEYALAEARQVAKNKSKVSLEQKRNESIQKVKDGLFDFLDSCGLIRAEERAELDKAIDDGVKEITSLVEVFQFDTGFNMDKIMAAATREKSQVNSHKINQELAGLNSLLDELMKGGLQ